MRRLRVLGGERSLVRAPGGEVGAHGEFTPGMREKHDSHSIGRRVAALAARAARRRARAGSSRAGPHAPIAIDARVSRGRLYGSIAASTRWAGRASRRMAASSPRCCAAAPGAALSHASAAVLWALAKERGPRIDVTVPSGGGAPAPRRARRSTARSSPRSEVTDRHGIPVTTPARTLLDLADVLTARRLERALDEAAYLRLDLAGLRAGQGPPRRGAARSGAGAARARCHAHALAARGDHAGPLPVVRPAGAGGQPAGSAATRSTSRGRGRG